MAHFSSISVPKLVDLHLSAAEITSAAGGSPPPALISFSPRSSSSSWELPCRNRPMALPPVEVMAFRTRRRDFKLGMQEGRKPSSLSRPLGPRLHRDTSRLSSECRSKDDRCPACDSKRRKSSLLSHDPPKDDRLMPETSKLTPLETSMATNNSVPFTPSSRGERLVEKHTQQARHFLFCVMFAIFVHRVRKISTLNQRKSSDLYVTRLLSLKEAIDLQPLGKRSLIPCH